MQIKFAGLFLNWEEQYAKIYCSKLIEMGFSAKVVKFQDHYIVAYSYNYFVVKDINLNSIEGYN